MGLVAYAAGRLLIFCWSVLPLSAALAMGRLLGSGAFHLLRLRRKVVEINLRHVLGDRLSKRELHSIAHEAYQQFGMNLAEIMRAAAGRVEDIDELVEISEFDALHQLHKAGSGLILCSPHAGNFDLMGYAAASRGLEMHAMMRPLNNRWFQNYLVQGRERMGVHVLQRGEESFREMFDLLDEGKTVALLPDQNARKYRVRVDFIGKPAWTFQAPAVLHLITGAPLVVAVDRRRRDDRSRHRVHLRFLPTHESTGDRTKDIREVTQAICNAMSEQILEAPGQYFWLHRRWGKELFRSKSAGA